MHLCSGSDCNMEMIKRIMNQIITEITERKKVVGTVKRKGAYWLVHSRGQFSKAEPGEKAVKESLERSHF